MDKVIVLKCGGSMLSNLPESFFSNISSLRKHGFKPVVVHGGGPEIKQMLQRLRIESTFVDGLRVTTEPMMEVVEMVLAGKVNQEITRRFNEAGMTSIGLSGSDAQLLIAKAKDYRRYGYVGEVTDVNTGLINQLLGQHIVPVIAPIAIGEKNVTYNVNADTAAGIIANRLHAEQLIFITDVPGIMKDHQLVESTTSEEIEQWIEQGIIYGGMIPKVQAAIDSLGGERKEVVISNGERLVPTKHAGLVGTVVKNSVEDG